MVSLPQRKSPRAQWYDYTSPGGYFVTICTQDREHYFGEVVDGEMILNELGKYCDQSIQDIASSRSAVEIHKYVVMPNHVHMIIMIGDGRDGSSNRPIGHDDASAGGKYNADALLMRPYKLLLGNIIKLFKGNVTKYAKKHNIPFAWQSRYHDHIIRDTRGYDTITHYIRTNPQNRKEDTFYS